MMVLIQINYLLLEFMLLNILNNDKTYAYEINNKIVSHLNVSQSMVYTALKTMQKKRLCYSECVVSKGRVRNYYILTSGGKEKLNEMKNYWEKDMESLHMILSV